MSGRYEIRIIIEDESSKLTGSFTTRSYIASLNGTKKSYGSYENALNSLAVDIINAFHKIQNNKEINKNVDK